MFCFARFQTFGMAPRQISATAGALAMGTNRNCGYHDLHGDTHFWCLTGDAGEARSWLPTVGDQGHYWLFAGFILNRDELVQQLGLPVGREYRDVDLYAHAFDAWKDGADDRIVGEYSAVSWHPPTQQTRMVRSAISAPPLHYAVRGDDHVVSSAPRGIFGTGFIERRVDEVKVADSLFMNYNDQERGWFEGVKRLPVANRIVIGPCGIRKERFFNVADLPRVRFSSDTEYVDAANHLFSEAVRRNINGFDRPAVSLSGGLDSQAAAVTALDCLPENQQLDVYTSVPQQQWDGRVHINRIGDEGPYARMLCDANPRLRPHMVDCEGLGFDHRQDDIFALAEVSPRNPMNLIWIHEIRSRARLDGCDVMLAPEWGNTTISFDGKWRLPTLFRQMKWVTLFRELAARSDNGQSVLHRFVSMGLLPNVPDFLQNGLKNLISGTAPLGIPDFSALDPAWAAHLGIHRRARELGFYQKPYINRSNREMRAGSHLGANCEGGDILQGIELLTGLPSRDPGGYRPLVTFCAGLPDDQFYRNGKSRILARRMMSGRLPDMVLNETRRGVQSADWFSRLESRREDIIRELDALEQSDKAVRRVDIPKLRKALTQWPTETPIGRFSAAPVLFQALPRALTTERFVRFFEK